MLSVALHNPSGHCWAIVLPAHASTLDGLCHLPEPPTCGRVPFGMSFDYLMAWKCLLMLISPERPTYRFLMVRFFQCALSPCYLRRPFKDATCGLALPLEGAAVTSRP